MAQMLKGLDDVRADVKQLRENGPVQQTKRAQQAQQVRFMAGSDNQTNRAQQEGPTNAQVRGMSGYESTNIDQSVKDGENATPSPSLPHAEDTAEEGTDEESATEAEAKEIFELLDQDEKGSVSLEQCYQFIRSTTQRAEHQQNVDTVVAQYRASGVERVCFAEFLQMHQHIRYSLLIVY
jgi:hypothetical protein